MAVGALEVGATGLGVGRDIPTTAALIGNQREVVVVGDFVHKVGVGLNGTETIGEREGRAT